MNVNAFVGQTMFKRLSIYYIVSVSSLAIADLEG